MVNVLIALIQRVSSVRLQHLLSTVKLVGICVPGLEPEAFGFLAVKTGFAN